MNALKGIGAAVGAAILAMSIGAGALAVGDGNTGGNSTNTPGVSGGTNTPANIGANVSTTSSSGNGLCRTNANTKQGSNAANASNHGGASGGGVRIGF